MAKNAKGSNQYTRRQKISGLVSEFKYQKIILKLKDPEFILNEDMTTSLVNEGDPLTINLIAEHPNTSPEVLERIVRELPNHRTALCSVAKNPNTTPEILTGLAHLDTIASDAVIRKYVAENPRIPPSVLIKLLKDKDWDVIKAARNNPLYDDGFRAMMALGE